MKRTAAFLPTAAHAAFLPLLPRRQLAGIAKQEGEHGQQHEGAVKHVHPPLRREQIPVVPHPVLHGTKDVAENDKDGRGVKHVNGRPPRDIGEVAVVAPAAVARRPEPPVERERDGNVDTEHDDLEDEAAEDDVLARLRVAGAGAAGALDEEAGAAGLHEEAEAVAEDEEAGEPARGDRGVLLAVDGDDDAAEGHVERGGEEDGCQEEEGGLRDAGVSIMETRGGEGRDTSALASADVPA